MIAEIGLYLLILALLCALFQMWAGFSMPQKAMEVLSCRLAKIQALLASASFGLLIYLFAVTDLSVLNVVQNSHTQKPFIYKIAASWASHEGSMLLWCTILSLFGLAIAKQKYLTGPPRQKALGAQGALGAGFLSFLIFTSSPFIRVFPVPPDGQDLNPLLQDLSLALHPPMLFLGYVGFSAQFSLAIAALTSSQGLSRDWLALARRVTLIAWSALTIGLCLGSYWAYYELGWGGWWFWDPVENAALIPWLTGTALLHSLRVVEVRGDLRKWTIILSIATFAFSILGTFLVRSGLLTSVHSFAVDPERGIFILSLAALYIGGALILYAIFARRLNGHSGFGLISRESVLVLNNLLLCTIAATVFIGTAYPIILPALGGPEISVGAPYFNTVLIPLALPMLILMGAGVYPAWRKVASGQKLSLILNISKPLCIAVLAFTGIMLWSKFDSMRTIPLAAAFWLSVAFWLMASMALFVWKNKRSVFLVPAQMAMVLAHFGVGLALIGIVGNGTLAHEKQALLSAGQSMEVAGYHIKLTDVKPVIGPNYYATKGVFNVTQALSGDEITTLSAERRTYPIAASQTTETGFQTGWIDTIYIALGVSGSDMGQSKELSQGFLINDDTSQERQWVVRVQVHPFMIYLWLGMGFVALSGLTHLLTGALRKYRSAGRINISEEIPVSSSDKNI